MNVLEIFRNMKTANKLAMIAMSFAIPIAMLSWLLVTEKNVEINSSMKEVDGIRYVIPVSGMMELVAKHRHMTTTYLSDGDVSMSQLEDARAKISGIIAEIDVIDNEVGATLDTSNQWNVIKQDWKELVETYVSLGSSMSFKIHNNLLENIRSLVSQAGDKSGLSLDPDIDSFYLAEIIVNKLPAISENLEISKSIATGIAARGEISDAQQVELYSDIKAAESLIGDIQADVKKAAGHNASIQTVLDSVLSKFSQDVLYFADIVKLEILQSVEVEADADEILDAGATAVQSGHALFEITAPTVKKLLEQRIGGLKQDLYISLALVGLSLLVSIVLTVWIMRMITRRVNRISETLNSISNGKYDNQIEVTSTDEIGQALGALALMQDKLSEMISTERTMAGRNTRIRQALNVVNANVMMADENNNITYVNEAVTAMFRNTQAEIRKVLPDFNADNLVGQNIDVFHKNPSHQRAMLAKLDDTFSSNLEIGGLTMQFVANPVMDNDGTRLGTVVEWTDLTESLAAEEATRQRLEEERVQAAENARIRQALDNVTANVMIADADYNIIYMNEAVHTIMKNAEADLRLELKNFDADQLMGTNIDSFHKNPAHQRDMLDRLTTTYSADMQIGPRHMRITANPIVGKSGTRLGTVVEWLDRTNEVSIENEIKGIVDASLAGDLSQRIDLSGKDGFFAMLSEGINDLIDVSERVINDTVDVMGAMASGDLMHSIEADYEGSFGQLKENINSTIGKLTEVMGEISDSAGNVSTASNEIAQGNTNLSQRTEEQAASLEETASSMEEMTSTIKQNADNARQADQLSSGAREQAEKGGQVVNQAITAMNEITTSSKKIADIIGVIDEIAFQTNLLALNAAVEAARAGEQGRGFAVVASEVRNLAGRSAVAAKEIKDLIQDSVLKVDEGSKLVDESGQTLEEIMTSVKKVSDIIAEIAAASQEQSDGIEQVNKAIAQMDETTQQNAALVEQAAAAAEAMGEQAGSLNQMVGFFNIGANAAGGNLSSERRTTSRPWLGNTGSSLGAGLDFSAARTKHLSWKTRLRSFLDGKESMTEAEAVSHHDCDLGKWIDTSGHQKYGHLPEMRQLESIHADLHGIIKDVVRMKHASNADGAERKFAQVESVSGKIVGLLNTIESKVAGDTAAPPARDTLASTGTDDEWSEF